MTYPGKLSVKDIPSDSYIAGFLQELRKSAGGGRAHMRLKQKNTFHDDGFVKGSYLFSYYIVGSPLESEAENFKTASPAFENTEQAPFF